MINQSDAIKKLLNKDKFSDAQLSKLREVYYDQAEDSLDLVYEDTMYENYLNELKNDQKFKSEKPQIVKKKPEKWLY